MTNQETNVSNGAESTLSSSLTSGGTTVNVTSTSGFPSVNFYAVIDPDDDSKREVVLATGKTATTLTVTRGQDGTSGVAHDSGAVIAVVPVAALWTDINDRVEGHTHSGGTDGAAIATGDLTGHNKAAHDALNINADQVDGNDASDLLARANHTGTQAISTLSDHNKANHDSLGLDHGSLSGLSDVADHPQYAHAAAHVRETGGGQSLPAGSETPLTLDETHFAANCSLASNTLTVTYGGAYRVYARLNFTSSSNPSGGTFRVKVNGTTELSASIGPQGGSSSVATVGVTDFNLTTSEVITLADGDEITLTAQPTGGSGHSTADVSLGVEKVG